MKASTDFLLALSTKLKDITDNTTDMETESELNESI